MLGVFLSGLIMAFTGYYVIKNIINYQEKINYKHIALLITIGVIDTLLYKVEYNKFNILTNFIINVIIYKNVFKIKYEESIISVGIMMLILTISDLLISLIFRSFLTLDFMRNEFTMVLIANIVIAGITILLIKIKLINKTLKKFYQYCLEKQLITTIILLTLLMVEFNINAYNIMSAKAWSVDYILNNIMMVAVIIIILMYVKNNNNYHQLSIEYDQLFDYIQNFEDWIEKERLNRHEYKNQLAVLRCLTKEKKVKNKIDEILEDNINIDGTTINELKVLPKGGIKGLMYYKVAIAQKKKINITIDASLEEKTILNRLSEKDIRTICKLIGIYFDNAIEAASETKKKKVLIEIYEFDNKVNFVFSNTFKNVLKDRNKKGTTTKGEGHGYGLYFASKLIKENDWIEEKQDIVDKYYIQQLIIKKKKSTKK